MKDLKEAVLEIADDMDGLSGNKGDWADVDVPQLLRSYAKQLRRVCKAAGDDAPAPPPSPPAPATDPMLMTMMLAGGQLGGMSSQWHNRQGIEAAKIKNRELKNKERAEQGLPPLPMPNFFDEGGPCDGLGTQVTPVMVADGPEVELNDGDPVWHNVDANIQVGQKPVIAGFVYEFRDDRKLHYLADDTRARNATIQRQQGGAAADDKTTESGIILGQA